MSDSPGAPVANAGWLRMAEEPAPPGNITDHTILRNDGLSVVCERSGAIDASLHESTGLYGRDTRYLSRLRFTLGGLEASMLDGTDDGTVLSAIFTNPAMVSPDGTQVPARALVVRRRRVLSGGLSETLTVSNYAGHPIAIDLHVDFDADFHDIFEVRGFARRSIAETPVASISGETVQYMYGGADGRQRTTRIHFDPPPTALEAKRAMFSMQLAAREDYAVQISVGVEQEPPAAPITTLIADARAEEQRFLAETTRIETDSEAVNQLIERALLDVRSLLTRHEGEIYVAAGAPWFDTLFGRDSLITGMLLAGFSPQLLRASLVVLAGHQAKDDDPETDAAPGKIPHELRWGELAQAGELPFRCYYGSVDSTPLFVMAALEYYRWTGDSLLISQLWPSLTAAIGWCVGSMDNGLLAYHRQSADGLVNQGWKDSHDAVMWPDGRLADPPLALVEVQGYLAAALAAYTELCWVTGHADDYDATNRARSLVSRISDVYGHPDLGYAFCIDGHGDALPTPTSNCGHLLWAGAARPDRALVAGARLVERDLFSGWGIRTMGANCAGFNPLGYHTGSVWPHDNAIVIGGLRRYGMHQEARLVATSLLEAALKFPGYHVPELFSGDTRDFRLVPTPYPVASRPQAWSAATVPYIFAVLLGLRPTADGRLAIVRPDLPLDLREVTVRNLQCQGGTVDLMFRKHQSHTSVEIIDSRGDTEIALMRSWPGALLASPT